MKKLTEEELRLVEAFDRGLEMRSDELKKFNDLVKVELKFNFNGELMNLREFNRSLNSLGIDKEIYYRRIVGLHEPPKCCCPDCNNDAEFCDVTRGYHIVCHDHRDLYRKNHRLTTPYRDKQKTTQLKRYEDPEARLITSEAMKKSNAEHPEYVKKRTESLKKTCNTPEGRLQLSKNSKSGWQNADEEKIWRMTMGGKRGKKSKLFSKYENCMIHFDSEWENKFLVKSSDDEENLFIKRKTGIKIEYYLPHEEELISKGIEVLPRFYNPDFLITRFNGEIWLVEIKPEEYMDDEIVQAKIKYAIPYCKSHGYRYVIFNDDLSTPHFYC